VIRVTGYVARVAAGNLARNAAERVPDRVSTAVFSRSTFDLVTAYVGSAQARVGVFSRATDLAVAKPHRKSLGRVEFDMDVDMMGLAEPQSAVLERGTLEGAAALCT
jgi:hypothetical protein